MTYKSKSTTNRKGPRTYRGKKVEDHVGEILNVNITTNDCRKGRPNSPGKCAAALAIKRSHPGDVIAVYVHRSFTYVELKDKMIRYRTGHALRDQSIRFDAGARKFDPGRYQICAVPPSIIKSRGRQHSAPDRAHGAPNSPKARSAGIKIPHHVGRRAFHFTTANSEGASRR